MQSVRRDDLRLELFSKQRDMLQNIAKDVSKTHPEVGLKGGRIWEELE